MTSKPTTSPVIKIREAIPGEESAIHEAHMRSIREVCIHDHGPEEIKGWGNRPLGNRWVTPIRQGFVWVVESEGNIYGLGYIKISHDEKQVAAHIYGLYLTPEVLGQGFGRKLTELMIGVAKEKGAKRITLGSSLTAHKFYLKFGFNDTGPMEKSDLGGSLVSGYPMALDL